MTEKCDDCDENMGLKPICQTCEWFDETLMPNYNTHSDICNMFKCVIPGGDCKQEYKRLQTMNLPLCVVCQHDKDCTDERRNALLGIDYLEKLKQEKEENKIGNVEKARQEHNYLERRYKELKDDMYKIPVWVFWSRKSIARKGWVIRRRIEIVREVFDWLGMDYEKEIDFSSGKQNNN